MHFDTELLLVAFLNANKALETSHYQTEIETKLHLTLNAPGFTATLTTLTSRGTGPGCIFQSQTKNYKRLFDDDY